MDIVNDSMIGNLIYFLHWHRNLLLSVSSFSYKFVQKSNTQRYRIRSVSIRIPKTQILSNWNRIFQKQEPKKMIFRNIQKLNEKYSEIIKRVLVPRWNSFRYLILSLKFQAKGEFNWRQLLPFQELAKALQNIFQ